MPATVMSLNNCVFKPYFDSYVILFIDDIFVNSKSEESYADDLHIFFMLFKKKLYAKCSNFDFLLNLISFLEHAISMEGVIVNPKKI